MAHTHSGFRFPRSERLKSRKLIQQLFREGRGFKLFPFRVLYMPLAPGSSPLQAGFSVSARLFSRSVDRNRIKRLMREAYRLGKGELSLILEQQDLSLALFFIFTDRNIPPFPFLRDKISVILDRLKVEFRPGDSLQPEQPGEIVPTEE